MKISVVIPTLNEEHYIAQILNDLKKQTLQPFEVLVIDGRSSDGTQEIVRSYPNVKLLSTSPSVGRQRTLGGKKATGEWLLFLDADVRIPRSFLKTLSKELELTRVTIACPIYTPLTKKVSVKLLFAALNGLFKFGQAHFPAGAGPCMIVTKKLFSSLNGFHTHLLNDDLEFIHRAGKAGSFKILPVEVFVSDRRFVKYGTLTVLWQYLQVSHYFVSGKLAKANSIKYPFGTFSKT